MTRVYEGHYRNIAFRGEGPHSSCRRYWESAWRGALRYRDDVMRFATFIIDI